MFYNVNLNIIDLSMARSNNYQAGLDIDSDASHADLWELNREVSQGLDRLRSILVQRGLTGAVVLLALLPCGVVDLLVRNVQDIISKLSNQTLYPLLFSITR